MQIIFSPLTPSPPPGMQAHDGVHLLAFTVDPVLQRDERCEERIS